MPNPLSDPALPPAIDLGHLRRQTLDDHALEAELLTLFRHQAQRIWHELAAVPAAERTRSRDRADLLHILCGSARAVGAWEVARHAEILERQQRATERDEVGLAIALPQLGQSVARACDAIDRLGAAMPTP